MEELKKAGYEESVAEIYAEFLTALFSKAAAKAAGPATGSVGAVGVPLLEAAPILAKGLQIAFQEQAAIYIMEHPELAGDEPRLRVDPRYIVAVILTMHGQGKLEYAGDILRAVASGEISLEQALQR